ncbi:hypothetical protein C6P40_002467 [Pichia californica]|uniref:Uncharacterized protein n=1 Tax=Pichia californica TaxID=460514 RepID=A0A9P6WJN8_9ASCO|nr:hypothetical protein C6P42_002760 [[Candida] californica]KAG0687352.1 hypothetical protein C6P40_002467 [[Candida] californica]
MKFQSLVKFSPSRERLLKNVYSLRYLSTFNSSSSYLKSTKSNILSSNSSLIPKLDFNSQLKHQLFRAFGTSNSLLDYYRSPKGSIIGGGIIGRLWSRIPDSIKILGAVGISVSFFLLVAVPVFVIVVPPLILGGIGLVALNRFIGKREMKKRWNAIADSSLMYIPPHARTLRSVPSPEVINSSLADFELNRIVDAFWDNDQGIADFFKLSNIDNLALGSLDAVQYSYNSESVVFADDFQMMVIQQRSLYDKSTGKEIANVILTLKCLDPPVFEDLDPSANITRGLVSIEIIPNGLFSKPFILKTPSVSNKGNDDDFDDGFINVSGKTRIL